MRSLVSRRKVNRPNQHPCGGNNTVHIYFQVGQSSLCYGNRVREIAVASGFTVVNSGSVAV